MTMNTAESYDSSKIKVLKGPLAGQSFSLKQGENVLGRSPEADIVIPSNGVSKVHAKFIVQGDQCVLTDSGSSNGTFVNGSKIRDRILRVGDKIGFHDVIVVLGADSAAASASQFPQMPRTPFDYHGLQISQQNLPQQNWGNNAAYQQQMQGQPQMGLPQVQGQQEPHGAAEMVKAYIEKVILPGVYY